MDQNTPKKSPMKFIPQVLVILAFLLFIFTASLITIIKPKETFSYYENRQYHQMPVLTEDDFLNGDYSNALESFFSDHAALRNTMLKTKTFLDVSIFNRPVVNQTVVKDDILLPWLKYMTFDEDSLKQNTENFASHLSDFNETVVSNGGVFYYVGVPCQYAYFEDKYPWYLENRSAYTAQTLSTFTQSMANNGVPFIDMGEVTRALGKPAYFGSLVDNHYGLEGAYLTYKTIMDAINSDTDFTLDYPSADEITFTALPNPYLGSRERKLLDLYGFDEQLKIASIAEPVALTRMDNGLPTSASVYAMPSSDTRPVFYYLYMGGDIAETVIQTNRPELPNVLIFGDSFTNTVETLAYNSFNEMRTIDLRHYKEMSLNDYVKLYKPDIVIGIRDYEVLTAQVGNGELMKKQP